MDYMDPIKASVPRRIRMTSNNDIPEYLKVIILLVVLALIILLTPA